MLRSELLRLLVVGSLVIGFWGASVYLIIDAMIPDSVEYAPDASKNASFWDMVGDFESFSNPEVEYELNPFVGFALILIISLLPVIIATVYFK